MDVTDTKHLRGRFRTLLLALVASFAAPGVWAAAPKVAFNIPAGEFSQAIIEFYKQSQIEILYASLGSVRDVKTRAVVGDLEVRDALKRMLEGTGFTFEFENARSVLVKRAAGNATKSNTADISVPIGTRNEQAQLASATENVHEGDRADMTEVTITGSYLHGVQDIVSPLVVIKEKEKKQTAYATVQDVLRTLPMNFGGGPNEDFSNTANFSRGSSVNLRGLGSGATLVLINGRRQPVSGIDGNFVDVSTIPMSAVERIEVLPDGSSALYGSDAIAGVVNIIMRDDLSGGETQARFGLALGGAEETLFSQSFGNHWEKGKLLFTYQYSERASLAAADRAYAATTDKRPFGGSDYRSPANNPGNILDPFTLQPRFSVPDGQDGQSLRPDELIAGANLRNQYEDRDLLPNRWMHSGFFTASQKLGERFELFGEGRYNYRRTTDRSGSYDQLLFVPSTNPFFVEPFGGMPFAIVAYSFFEDFGSIYGSSQTKTYAGTLGVHAKVTDKWQATLSEFRGREDMRWTGHNLVDFTALSAALADPNPATAFNPFGSGSNTNPATLEAIRLVQREDALSGTTTTNLVVDGPLPDLHAGTPRLALGLDNRKESLTRGESFNSNAVSAHYERSIRAAFAELSVPLIPRLDFSLAARYEAYSDFGNTFNPKIGIRWLPFESVRLRSSWGSSFRAPTLVDLYDRSQDAAFLTSIMDPYSESGQSVVLVRSGTNESLHEETAVTWTVGVDFASPSRPGFSLSSTYFVVKYDDQTWRPSGSLTLESLLSASQWASLVTRNPSQLEVDSICASSVFMGLPSDCTTNAPAAILDARVRNLSVTTTSGVDLELRQSLQNSFGRFDFGLNGSYLFSFKQALTQAAPAIELVDTVGNPASLRIHGIAEWSQYGRNRPGFGVSVAADFLDSFRDYEAPPVTRIGSWVTFDLQVSYRTTTETNDWMGGVGLVLHAANLFNESPPFVNRILGYDAANAKPYGRVISFDIQKKW